MSEAAGQEPQPTAPTAKAAPASIVVTNEELVKQRTEWVGVLEKEAALWKAKFEEAKKDKEELKMCCSLLASSSALSMPMHTALQGHRAAVDEAA